jgi:hypothetical protein
MVRGITYVSNTRILLQTVLALNLLTQLKIKPKSYGPVVTLFITKIKPVSRKNPTTAIPPYFGTNEQGAEPGL